MSYAELKSYNCKILAYIVTLHNDKRCRLQAYNELATRPEFKTQYGWLKEYADDLEGCV